MLGRLGYAGELTLVSEETDRPYDRTFCSKQYLAGKAPREKLPLTGPGFPAEGGPHLRLGTRATAIDLAARTVALADGTSLPFDALVLAMGAEPMPPDVPGFERANVHVLRSLSDADAIIAAARPGARAAVVGSSFIGLEAAASLIARKLAVTVVSPDAVPLAKVLGEEVGRFVQGLHEKNGVVFRLGREVTGFDGRALTLDDGTTIEADFVVVGTGVAPRTQLAEAAGLALAPRETGGGVSVDPRLETATPGVYAVGDLASYPDPRHGRPLRVEHWVHAERQGQHVARVLVGRLSGPAAVFAQTPFFWSGHYGTSLRYVGHAKPAQVRIDGSVDEGDFAARYLEDGREAALATVKRDPLSLATEAAWDSAAHSI